MSLFSTIWQNLKKRELAFALFKTGLQAVSARGLAIVMGFFSSVVLARMLGAQELGRYSYVLSLVLILAFPVRAGLMNLVLRETARSRTDNKPARMLGIWHWASRYILRASLCVISLSLLAIFLYEQFAPLARRDLILVGLTLIPLLALVELREAALRGFKHIFRAQFPYHILRPAILIVLLIVASWGLALELNAFVALILFVGATLIALGVAHLFFTRIKPAVVTKTELDIDRVKWRAAVLLLGLSAGVLILNTNYDILVIGNLRSDTEVGLYRIAVVLAGIILNIPAVIAMVTGPYYSQLLAQRQDQTVIKILLSSTLISAALALPCLLAYLILGDGLIAFIYGEGFRASFAATLILSTGSLIAAVFHSANILLLIGENERLVLRAAIAALAINLVLNPIFVTYWGIEGAAIATAISLAVKGFLCWRAVRGIYGLRALPVEIWQILKRKPSPGLRG